MTAILLTPQPLPLSQKFRFSTVPVGSVAYGSVGTAVSCVNGTTYWASVYITGTMVMTGIGVLNGGTVGTNNGLVALYNADGVLVANSALAGALTASANAFQQRAFTSPYTALGPGLYYIAYQANGATDNVRMVAASTFIDVLTKSAAGTFGTLPALVVPTTFTADVGPVAYVY